MSIIDQLISLLAPYSCLGCAVQGNLLCNVCRIGLSPAPSLCYACQQPSAEGKTCTACLTPARPRTVQAAVAYQGLAKDLLWKLKSGGAQQAVRPMAQCILSHMRGASAYLIVPVPTATSRVRQRGYDQASLLARELAHQTGLPHARLLTRVGQTHQVGAARSQRQIQLQGAFRARSPARVRGASLLLVDDVLTTGATLEAAAAVLYQAGAGRVDAITFARA